VNVGISYFWFMRIVTAPFSLLWKLHIAIVFLLTTILFYPLILPFLFSEKSKKHSFKFFVAWSWCVRIFCFYFVVKKLDNPLPKGPYIIIANHMSYLDIFLMPSIFPKNRFLFLGKSEILKYPLIKTYFKRLNIPLFRKNPIKSAKALIRSKQEMKKGWSLIIFPEGSIPDVDLPKMIEFKEGAFQLAKSCRAPIVPVTFTNNHKLLSDPSHVFGPARPGNSYVHVHPFITVDEVKSLTKSELKDKCFDLIKGPIAKQYPDLQD